MTFNEMNDFFLIFSKNNYSILNLQLPGTSEINFGGLPNAEFN